jgi:hypothetical protein
MFDSIPLPAGEIANPSKAFLESLFQPDDLVAIYDCRESDRKKAHDERTKYSPGAGATRKVSELISAMDAGGSILDLYPNERTLFIRANPMQPNGRSDREVATYRYVLVDIDKDEHGSEYPLEVQYGALIASKLPLASVTYSGDISLAALVRVDAETEVEYRSRKEEVYRRMKQFIKVDETCGNPSRWTRFPGGVRHLGDRGDGDVYQEQRLIALNQGTSCWGEFLAAMDKEKDQCAAFARVNGLPITSKQGMGYEVQNDLKPIVNNSSAGNSSDGEGETQGPKAKSAIYYMKQGGNYLWEQPSGQVVFANEASAKRALKQEAVFENPSKEQIEGKLYEIQVGRALDYAGSLPGYRTGVHIENGMMLYCMQAPVLPDAISTDGAAFGASWPTTYELMRRLFVVNEDEDQLWTILAHLKSSVAVLRGLLNPLETNSKRSVQPGQAMALVGPKNSGKSLFVAQIITPLLGGRIVDAFKAFTADSDGFNGELLNGEIWLIDDQEHSTDIRNRRKLAAHLKSKLFGASVAFHPKHKTPVTVTPFGRLFICCNSTPENLTVLPPITEDISDKIHLILCNKAEMPMPTNSENERKLFREQLAREIPYLTGELTDWTIPEKFQSERTGVKSYLNPWIESQLRKQSPEAQLAEMIIMAVNSGLIDRDEWKGTSRELKDVLTGENFGARRDAINLLGSWNAATGTYLSRLAANRETYIREFGLDVTELGARGGIERYSLKNLKPGRHLDHLMEQGCR